MNKFYEDNVCPKCGYREGLDYGKLEKGEFGAFYYEFVCPKCGATGIEHYSLKYEFTECDNNENNKC